MVKRMVEAIAVALLVADAAFYFGVYRSLGSETASEQQKYMHMRQGWRDRQALVDRLEKFKRDFPSTVQWLADFAKAHTPSDRQGFSTAANLIRKAASDAGVQVATVGFHSDPKHKDPFEPLGLEVRTQGSYPGLIKFAHSLETADDFILVRQFGFATDDKGAISLRLVGDFYLTP
jgi:hypothetical protein